MDKREQMTFTGGNPQEEPPRRVAKKSKKRFLWLALVTLLPICISLWMLSSCLRQQDKAALQVELHEAQERMQGTVVEQGVEMEYIVTDKNVTITERRHLKGNENFPVYVEKGTVV